MNKKLSVAIAELQLAQAIFDADPLDTQFAAHLTNAKNLITQAEQGGMNPGGNDT